MSDSYSILNKVYFINARSLKSLSSSHNEMFAYHNIFAVEKPDIFAAVETWLTPDVLLSC